MTAINDIKLTTEQRIAALEETARKNQFQLLVVSTALALVSIIALVLMIMQLVYPPSGFAKADSYEQTKEELAQLENQTIDWYQQVESLRFELDNSQAAVFKTLMFEQEESNQLHLKALKQTMQDLASKQPGSRAWLDAFNRKIDTSIALSKARLNKLGQVKTSEQPTIEAVPLPFQPTPINVTN